MDKDINILQTEHMIYFKEFLETFGESREDIDSDSFDIFNKLKKEDHYILYSYIKTKQLIKENKIKYHYLNDNACYYSYINNAKAKNIIVIPGGGYENVCSMTEGFPIAVKFYELGYNVFVCTYGIKENAVFPKPVIDIIDCYKHIKNEYNIKEYGLIGFSAGAHLVGLLSLKDIGFRKYNLDNPAYIGLCYPVITMGEYTHINSRRFLMGDKITDSLIHQLSIDENVDKEFPKTYIWTCERDDIVNSLNTKLMVEALKKNNIEYKVEIFDSHIHGLGVGYNSPAENWMERCVDFWSK